MKRFALLAAVLTAGCASTPEQPPPLTGEMAAIGISVKLNLFWYDPMDHMKVVYFVRLDEAGKPIDDTLIPSNFHKDTRFHKETRIYLLNTPPGRYSAVAARYDLEEPNSSSAIWQHFVFFPDTLIEATAVLTSAGQLAYAGHYEIDTSLGVCAKDSDESQLQYATQLSPDTVKCGFLPMLLDTIRKHPPAAVVRGVGIPEGQIPHFYRGSLKATRRDAAAEAAFRQLAAKDLADTGWAMSP